MSSKTTSAETEMAEVLGTFQRTILENRWIPSKPHNKQARFLMLPHREALFGGAGGPGKSEALLMAALQYVNVKGYSALLLRRTYKDLSQPKGLMDRADQWLKGTPAKWKDQDKTWTFPSGAKLVFGHLEHRRAEESYTEYQFIGIDEVTQFDERRCAFLFSKLRKTIELRDIPARMRCASNPVGIGVDWVKRRFITSPSDDTTFVPARLDDNPYIDREDYIKSLMHLDPITRAKILEGDWDIGEGAKVVSREWFKELLDFIPKNVAVRVRFWDLAASTSDESSYTAGVRISKTFEGKYIVEHVTRGRWMPGERDGIIKQVAQLDGKSVPIFVEQEGGSGGKAQNEAIIKMLAGWSVTSVPASGDKVTRLGPFASQAQIGNVSIVRGNWNTEYLDELHAFPEAKIKDQCDATSGAFNCLSTIRIRNQSNIVGSSRFPTRKFREDFSGISPNFY